MTAGADRSRRWRVVHPGGDKRRGDRHVSRPSNFTQVVPFVGCDGEGCGLDAIGRQLYTLFRIGDRELFTGGRHLGTTELLDFICDSPPPGQAILVGFSFGYDATMILRDLSSERRERLLSPPASGPGRSRYTFYDTFGIEYLPKQYFRVCRLRRHSDGTIRQIPGSARTIYETFGFFQASFLKTLKQFSLGAEHLELIEKNKAARETFDHITAEIREYNRVECVLLAELMEKFRASCHTVDIRPRTWNGAGKLAAALHQREHTVTAKTLQDLVPEGVRDMAAAAYYGGRFEITRVGDISGPIHEYDINSAYPAAMARLPCLMHGGWQRLSVSDRMDITLGGGADLYVAYVAFTHPVAQPGGLCGLPLRDKGGHISWPVSGRGVYWSVELRSAVALGTRLKIMGGWRYVKRCDCCMFPWVESLYDYRKSIGKSAEGYPIKLGINSLYGKLSQRMGTPRWGNFIWAGLITAHTRASVNGAIALTPRDIVMIATDGVYSRKPLALPTGDKLGEWEHAEHARMFVVQPGLYWGPPRPKTRGVPAKFFETRTGEFEKVWRCYVEEIKAAVRPVALEYPSATVDITLFIGLKLAQSRGKPDTAGCWVSQARKISFDWTRKRSAACAWEGATAVTSPLPGGLLLDSMIYTDATTRTVNIWDEDKAVLDDQPDYLDLSPPWKG